MAGSRRSPRHEQQSSVPITPSPAQRNFLRAIDLDPGNALAYHNLGLTLNQHSIVVLLNETKWTRRHLLIKALELDPQNAEMFTALSTDLELHERVKSLDKLWTRQTLLEHAVALDADSADACNNLGTLLKVGDSVDLGSAGQFDAVALFMRAIQLQPKLAEAYSNLGGVMKSTDEVRFAGITWTKQQLLIEAIRLDSSLAHAYQSLALALGHDASARARLPDGTLWSRRELHMKAIELSPRIVEAWAGLAETMLSTEEVQLNDGTCWMRHSIQARVRGMDRCHLKAHDALTKERWAHREVEIKPTTESRPAPMSVIRKFPALR